MGIKVERAEAPLAQFYVEKQPWIKDGACVGTTDPEMFFDFTAQALCKKVCKTCPVRRECAEQAMLEEGSAPHGRYGYRGCLSPSQRRALYRNGGLKGRDPAGRAVQGVR